MYYLLCKALVEEAESVKDRGNLSDSYKKLGNV